MLLAGFSSFSQTYDYMQEPGPHWQHFYEPFILLPFAEPHDSCCLPSFRKRLFSEHIDRMYNNPEYYLEKSREMDFKFILLRIVDKEYKQKYYDELVSMGDLINIIDTRFRAERKARKAEEKLVDSVVKSPELIVKNDLLKSLAPHYKILQAIAKYHNLKLELKDPIGAYMARCDITMNIKDLHRVLCVMHASTGFCYTPIDGRLVVQRINPNDCKCDCDAKWSGN